MKLNHCHNRGNSGKTHNEQTIFDRFYSIANNSKYKNIKSSFLFCFAFILLSISAHKTFPEWIQTGKTKNLTWYFMGNFAEHSTKHRHKEAMNNSCHKCRWIYGGTNFLLENKIFRDFFGLKHSRVFSPFLSILRWFHE